jgi:hypothetical protein
VRVFLTLHKDDSRFAAECTFNDQVIDVFRSFRGGAFGATWDADARHVRMRRAWRVCVLA